MMKFDPTVVAVSVLAVWRGTHLLTAEDGPWDAILHLRRLLGRMLDCFYCLSFWIAAPIAVITASGLGERILLWLAYSGGAVLLEKLTEARQAQWHTEGDQ